MHAAARNVPDADARGAPPQQTWSPRQVPSLEHTLAPADARHAYAVLRGLTGARRRMVAAATTSRCPSARAEGRSYDYRYVWIRDQC